MEISPCIIMLSIAPLLIVAFLVVDNIRAIKKFLFFPFVTLSRVGRMRIPPLRIAYSLLVGTGMACAVVFTALHFSTSPIKLVPCGGKTESKAEAAPAKAAKTCDCPL